MAEPFHALAVLAGIAFGAGVCMASITFSIASVCRWMKWSPVTINVNIIGAKPADPFLSQELPDPSVK